MKFFLIFLILFAGINNAFSETFSQIVFGKNQYTCDVTVFINDNAKSSIQLKLISYNGYIKLINSREESSAIINIEKELISMNTKNHTYANHAKELEIIKESQLNDFDLMLLSGNNSKLISKSKKDEGKYTELLISNTHAKHPFKVIIDSTNGIITIFSNENRKFLKLTNISLSANKSEFSIPSSYIFQEEKQKLNER